MRTPCILKKRATPNGATPRHFTALRFKVALQRCLYPSCGTIIVSLDGLRRQLAQFAPDRRLNVLRTGGSSHTGQAAPPHRNIQWVIGTYPGSFSLDIVGEIRQYFGYQTVLTNRDPPFHTLLSGILIQLGQILFDDANIGAFLYIIFQMILGVIVFSYGLCKLKKLFHIKIQFLYFFAFFYGFFPLWGGFVSWFEKDLIFSEFIALFVIELIEITKHRGITIQKCIRLTGISIISSLLRNNGVMLVLPTLVVLAVSFWKVTKLGIMSLAIYVTSIICINCIIYPALGIVKKTEADVFSVMFQQTARYVKYYGTDVTEEERMSIDEVLDYKDLSKYYNPRITDPIKDCYKGDLEKIPQYIKTWAKMFLKKPGCYVSAFINGAYGYIAPVSVCFDPSPKSFWKRDLGILGLTDHLRMMEEIGFKEQTNEKAITSLASIRDYCIDTPILNFLCMPGTYTWILAYCLFLLRKIRYKPIIIAFIPCISCLLSCILSPLSNATRYELPIIGCIPFLLGLTIYFGNSQKMFCYEKV